MSAPAGGGALFIAPTSPPIGGLTLDDPVTHIVQRPGDPRSEQGCIQEETGFLRPVTKQG